MLNFFLKKSLSSFLFLLAKARAAFSLSEGRVVKYIVALRKSFDTEQSVTVIKEEGPLYGFFYFIFA